MTDEPDLSMLEPTTPLFLRLRAEDYALARVRYAPDDPRHYDPPFGEDTCSLIDSTLCTGFMVEMNRAYNLTRDLNRFAAHACQRHARHE